MRLGLTGTAVVDIELIADAGLVIEPVMREQAIERYIENLRPILRRESLELASGWPAQAG